MPISRCSQTAPFMLQRQDHRRAGRRHADPCRLFRLRLIKQRYIYLGLIELHNHLAYNALKLWKVPKLYQNRGQWTSHPEYKQLVLDPMKEIKRRPRLLPAIARYAECKCLLGGGTKAKEFGSTGRGHTLLTSRASCETWNRQMRPLARGAYEHFRCRSQQME